MLLEVVDHIGVDDSKPEMFTMDRSSGKLLKRFCHMWSRSGTFLVRLVVGTRSSMMMSVT